MCNSLIYQRSSLSFIDFEGRSDGNSIKQILAMMKPRQIVIVHGSIEATAYLVDIAHNVIGIDKNKIFAPSVGETIDVTTESGIYQVKLTDSLMSGTVFAQSKDTELAWIDGQIQTNPHQNDGVSVLNVLPPSQVKGHKSVFINPPRLSDFKNILGRAGIQAEFSGGILVCNGNVAIRRIDGGKIAIEGAVCDDYYLIRKLLYEQFAIV
jgi:cleavage and polyadenylation specificity factor subunit 2